MRLGAGWHRARSVITGEERRETKGGALRVRDHQGKYGQASGNIAQTVGVRGKAAERLTRKILGGLEETT